MFNRGGDILFERRQTLFAAKQNSRVVVCGRRSKTLGITSVLDVGILVWSTPPSLTPQPPSVSLPLTSTYLTLSIDIPYFLQYYLNIIGADPGPSIGLFFLLFIIIWSHYVYLCKSIDIDICLLYYKPRLTRCISSWILAIFCIDSFSMINLSYLESVYIKA